MRGMRPDNPLQGEVDWREPVESSPSPSLWQFLGFCRHSLWEVFSGYLGNYSTSNIAFQLAKESLKSELDGLSALKEKSTAYINSKGGD